MSDPVSQAAEILLASRRDPSKKPADLPEAAKPKDRAGSYAIQAAVAKTFPGIGGWKVGPLGAQDPLCGALSTEGVIPGPAKVKTNQYARRAIKSELCVKMGKDLPPRATPYSKEEVAAAIESIHPAIELLDSRFQDRTKLDPLVGLADTQAHAWLVVGQGVTNWKSIDTAKESVQQFVDGAVNAEHTGHPGNDIVGQVAWLANTGSVWAGGLKKGQYVTCGSWTGANEVGPTAKVRTKFSTVGEVSMEYVG